MKSFEPSGSVLNATEGQQRQLLDAVLDWQTVEYDDGFQTLLVTYTGQEKVYEKWVWPLSLAEQMTPTQLLTRLSWNGVDDQNLFRVIATFAKLVKRAKTLQEINYPTL